MSPSSNQKEAVYSLRVDRKQLKRLHEIADAEHRTVAQKLRLMIEREIDQAEEQAA